MTTTKRAVPSLLAALSVCDVDSNNVLRLPKSLNMQTEYGAKDLIERSGGTWDKEAKGYVFPQDIDPRDRLTDLLAFGHPVEPGALSRFVDVPTRVANDLVNLAKPEPGQIVLLTNARTGKVLKALQKSGFPGIVDLFEPDPKNLLRLAREFRQAFVLMGKDFMDVRMEPVVDRAICLPCLDRGEDVRLVTAAYQVLRTGGQLVALLSPGWTFRDDIAHAAFRAFFMTLEKQNKAARLDLPIGALEVGGEGIAVNMVLLQK